MTLLIIIGLLCIAALYGIFFLIFKLVWLLFKNKRNLWPLVLAGAATAAIVVLTAVAVTRAARAFVKPFTPIIEAVQTRNAPVYGAHVYTDPRYGFTMTLYNGTVMSDWIDWNGFKALAAFDTNALVKTADGKQETPFALFGVLPQQTNEKADVYEIMRKMVLQLNGASSAQGRVEMDENIQYVDAGPGATAAFAQGTAYVENMPGGIPVALLAAAQGRTVFYVAGFGTAPDGEIPNTVRSFRFSSPRASLQ